ncbi:MAG: hypothetical protein HQM08_22755 [Candidatus Riflebacteria bacterium]|nr:hypothetical protein [Candidatus Riflebacteria bacterium]
MLRKSILFLGFVVLIFLIDSAISPVPSKRPFTDLKPYIDFLTKPHLTPVDYVMSLFDKADIVIICERSHPEFTQYEFFLELAKDPRFIERVGTIFTEIGTIQMRPVIADFLQVEGLTSAQKEKKVLDISRSLSWMPYWGRYNFHVFLKCLCDINCGLSANRKIRLFPSDIPFSWEGMTKKNTLNSWILSVPAIRSWQKESLKPSEKSRAPRTREKRLW